MNYSTRQKALILECLREHPDRCFSVKELLAENRLNVGEATVYRALARFVEEGSVKKYVGADGSGAMYQYAGGEECESHFHLKCLSCGRLFHTECEVIGEMIAHIKAEHNFTVDAAHTTIYGICGDCAAKDAEGGENS